MTNETKKTSVPATLAVMAVIAVLVGVFIQANKDCDDCLVMSVIFEPANRKENVRIWIDVNQVRLQTWDTKHSPWGYTLKVEPGTRVRLAANQISLTQVGILDCQISDGKTEPIHNYRMGNGEVACDYPRY